MSRSLSVVMLTLVLTGCTKESTPPTVATLAGTITARSFSAPTTTHYGWILVAAGPACEQQIALAMASAPRWGRLDGPTASTNWRTIGGGGSGQYSGLDPMSRPLRSGADGVTLSASPGLP